MDTMSSAGKQRVQLRASVLRQVAAQRNLSLGDVAIDAGIDPAHFSSILNGKRPAGPGVRRRLCRALKLSFDDLFEITPEGERAQVIAASGSGGSAQGKPPQFGLRFGEIAFGQVPGSPVPPLMDDAGNPLILGKCDKDACIGSHIWMHPDGARVYCEGPDA